MGPMRRCAIAPEQATDRPGGRTHDADAAGERPKPPADLGVEGRKMFRQIVADAAGQGVELTASELVYLRQAGKCSDTIALLEAALDGAELLVPGYMGKGTVSNPLLAELRQTRMLLGQLVARIKTDVPEV